MYSQLRYTRCIMLQSTRITILVSLLFFVTQYSTAFHEVNNSVVNQSKQSVTASKYDPRASRYSLMIAKAISLSEFQSFLEIMKLDEPQRVFSELLFEEYLEKDKIRRAELCIPLWQRSAELLASRNDISEIQHADAIVELLKDGRKVQLQLVKLENELFAECESILKEDQLPQMERVHLQRNRVRWSAFGSMYHFGEIDLAILMRDLLKKDEVNQSIKQALNIVMLEYDKAVTPLFKRRYRATFNATIKNTILMAPLIQRPGDPPLELEEQDELNKLAERNFKQRRINNRAYIKPAKRIHSLNQKYLIALKEILPGYTSKELRRRFQQKAYRSIYPNPFDVSHILEAALDIEDLSSEQRETLEAQNISYSQHSRQICDKMENNYESWYEALSETQQKPRDKSEAYEKEMQELDIARHEAAELALSLIEDFLNPEQLSQIKGLTDRYMKQLSQFQQRKDSRMSRWLTR